MLPKRLTHPVAKSIYTLVILIVIVILIWFIFDYD